VELLIGVLKAQKKISLVAHSEGLWQFRFRGSIDLRKNVKIVMSYVLFRVNIFNNWCFIYIEGDLSLK